VNVSVFPVEPDSLEVGATAIVPDPSAESTLIDGDAARFVNVPPLVDFSCACQVAGPAVVVAVAPAPPEAFDPYVIVNVEPPARVTPETVIV
jgi:hypothetical protein